MTCPADRDYEDWREENARQQQQQGDEAAFYGQMREQEELHMHAMTVTLDMAYAALARRDAQERAA